MKTFGLENVKAFRDTGDIELSPITIFVGQNSCGKSSFIRFPVVLSQSLLDGSFPLCLHSERSNLVDYGSFEDVIYNHEGNTFSCKFSYNSVNLPDYRFLFDFFELYQIYQRFDQDVEIEGVSKHEVHESTVFGNEKRGRIIHVTITYTQDYKTKNLVICSYKVIWDNEMAFSFNRTHDGKYIYSQKKSFMKGFSVHNDYEICIESDTDSFFLSFDIWEGLAEIISGFIGTDSTDLIVRRLKAELPDKRIDYVLDDLYYGKEWYNNLVKKCSAFLHSILVKKLIDKAISSEMECLYYIGPFRSNPKRLYRRDETTIQNVGVYGEYTTKMLVNDSIGRKVITNEVSRWLRDAFNYELCIEHLSNEFYQVYLKDLRTESKSNIMDVGYGVSQVLPIVSQISKAVLANTSKGQKRDNNKNEMYVIEQPELHLHPAAQSKLADLFVNALSNNAVNYRKFLIETHSEHLIRALQVLIADPNSFLTNDMVKFYYVDKGEAGSVIKEMKTNEYGQFIERWPKGFFDEAHIMSRKLMDVVAERKSSKETGDD